jgi:hypothetical protein
MNGLLKVRAAGLRHVAQDRSCVRSAWEGARKKRAACVKAV